MKRGEIWTAAGASDYGGKPRPVLILQSDRFYLTDSITICPLTSDTTESPLLRLAISPSESNGLRVVSRLMMDKIATSPKSKLGKRIGALENADIQRLNRAVAVFLGIAS